ncbi:degenerin deg-1-like [Dendronephthya gigantea]|uniref:degenerin deg-1-like n=1 Tax=Dendronephthya gigantea TaxID=151771 RepID=UPI00106CC26F|nr:degenerin deg-1-like [Dendronephthya gigantea]
MDNEKNEAERKRSLRDILVDFMGYTTGHGFARLVAATSIAWRIFWIVAVLGATGMFVYQVSDLFKLYLARPVQTSVTVTFEKKLKFPAVTICNLNLIKRSKMVMLPGKLVENFKLNTTYYYVDKKKTVSDSTKTETKGNGMTNMTESPNPNKLVNSTEKPIQTFYSATQPSKGIITEKPSTPISSTAESKSKTKLRKKREIKKEEYLPPPGTEPGYTAYDASTWEDKTDKDILDEYPPEGKLSQEAKLRIRVESFIGEQDPFSLYSLGHEQQDFIKSCTWKGVDCAKGNLSKFWTESWNYRYGNCFTFNDGVDEKEAPLRVLQSSKPGPSQGLVLKLDIEENEYIGELTEEAGVRVVLHEPGVMRFPFEEGFSVAPGMATSVGLTITNMKRLDRFSDGSCFDESVQLAPNNLYRRKRNITRYSLQACLNSCLGESQLAICKCAEAAYPTDKPCNLLNHKNRTCLQMVKYLFSKDELPCIENCKRPCREDVYEKTISTSMWPSKANLEFLSTTDAATPNRSSVLLLNIFYSQLNYHVIEESFSYGTTNLLADIGGQLGLWIGISALTCGEILELIFQIITFAYMKFKYRKKIQVIRIGDTVKR